MPDTSDIAVAVSAILLWATVVLSEYALAQHLRRTLETAARKNRLYHYARQGWEARFVIWGGISGALVGVASDNSFTLNVLWFPLVVAVFGALIIGFGSMIVASRAGFGSDIADHPTQAIVFSALGVFVFLLAFLSVKMATSETFPDLPDFVEHLTVVGTMVGIILGLLSIWDRLRRSQD